MSNPYFVIVATIVIIGLSAFFVAVEFAVIGAKKHRLEDAATGSASARAALRNSSELTLLLAGSQLGITACTLALGAISKPAVQYSLTPLLQDWGLATWLADVAGFVLALAIVTFLHLVVGEMAPKSWAIAHPERSATLLAVPMRAFMWLTRPTLKLLNGAANWCLNRVGVDAVDEVESQTDPDSLRQLVEHSAETGALDRQRSEAVMSALEFDATTVGEVAREGRPTGVPRAATVADVQAAARRTGHLRILLETPDGPSGVVHVRDTVGLPAGSPAVDHERPLLHLAADATLPAALATMQAERAQIAWLAERGAVVTVSDLLARLLPAAA